MDAFAILSRSSNLFKPAKNQVPETISEATTAGTDRAIVSPKKRKRQHGGQGSADNAGNDALDGDKVKSPDECRQILKKHKVKISALWYPEQASQLAKRSSSRKHSRDEGIRADDDRGKSKHENIVIPPLTSFVQLRTQFELPEALMRNLEAQAFKHPTDVQLGSLPLLLAQESYLSTQPGSKGRVPACNLMTVAPTGSGKTLAFLIPAIASILQRKKSGQQPPDGPQVIIVAPTKELARQIVNESRKMCSRTGIRTTLVRRGVSLYGDGTNLEEDELSEDEDAGAAIKRDSKHALKADEVRVKSQILVATPLALIHAATPSSTEHVVLPTVESLILDEADVLLDPLFREQTMKIWKACTNKNLCVGLWSATVSSSIEELALQEFKERVAVSTNVLPFYRLVIGLKDSSIPNIDHQLVYAASEKGKLMGIRQLLHAPSTSPSGNTLRPPFLVFTQTITRATALHSELLYDIPIEAGGSTRIAVLHADLSEMARDGIMTRLRKGEIWVLITTDLLARGIDFHGINGVVNYDLPTSSAAYVHRVGRTGRAGKEGGVAVTLYSKEDLPFVKSIANVINVSQRIRGGDEEAEKHRQWLLHSLPKVSKKDRQDLKRRGVESRRNAGPSHRKDGSKNTKTQISTKGGFVRRLENKKKGAIEGSKRRKGGIPESPSAEDFAGLD